MQTSYAVDYFIQKFENTRENKWSINNLHDGGNSCANGWCGVTGYWSNKKTNQWTIVPTEEGIGLAIVFRILETEEIFDQYHEYSEIAANINNGNHPSYQQSTPKKRILAALYDIKRMTQEPEPSPKTIIRYVAVNEEIREDAKQRIIEQSFS